MGHKTKREGIPLSFASASWYVVAFDGGNKDIIFSTPKKNGGGETEVTHFLTLKCILFNVLLGDIVVGNPWRFHDCRRAGKAVPLEGTPLPVLISKMLNYVFFYVCQP